MTSDDADALLAHGDCGALLDVDPAPLYAAAAEGRARRWWISTVVRDLRAIHD